MRSSSPFRSWQAPHRALTSRIPANMYEFQTYYQQSHATHQSQRVLNNQPNAYITLLDIAQSARRSWERSASVLVRRAQDLVLLRVCLAACFNLVRPLIFPGPHRSLGPIVWPRATNTYKVQQPLN